LSGSRKAAKGILGGGTTVPLQARAVPSF